MPKANSNGPFPSRTRSAGVNKGYPSRTRSAAVKGTKTTIDKGKALVNKKGLPHGRSG